MVATRRGVRVSYTAKTNPEQAADVQATPSTSQRSRRHAKHEDSPTHHVLVESCSHLEKSAGPLEVSPSSTKKRCTRASRLHSPEQPCTPVGSIREGDASDAESCCSAVSDLELVLTRNRRRRQPRTVNCEDEEISEVESCSSAVSASKRGQSNRRSTRRKAVLDAVQGETEDVRQDEVLETSSSMVSQRVTRSQRKSARTRSSAKQLTEDSELSDADSCISSVSGTNAPTSTSRRATRSRKRLSPVPMDKMSEGSESPILTGRRTRAARGKAPAAAAYVSEPPSCDSEGFESGPSYSVATRKMGKSAVDSGSEVGEVHSPVGSPCSTRSRGTPCSSRTGSGSSSRRAMATRSSFKDFSGVKEPALEDSSLNNSMLESTVIAEDADCTLLEEDKSQTVSEQDLNLTSSQTDRQEDEKEVIKIPEDLVSGAAVTESAVITKDQQEEPSAENNAEDSSQMEMMQETVPPPEPVTISERAPEATAEDGEKPDVADVDIQAEKPVDEIAAVETGPCVEEKMEVGMLDADSPQVVDSSEVQGESIQVTSRPDHMIRVESDSEQQPKDIIIQNTKAISLLDSTDDEDEYNELEEKEGSEEEGEEEDLGYRETRGEPFTKSEAASESVEGLFMIDTRPGQDADDLYYKDRGEEEAATTKDTEQEEDEEFVDEEVDDDDEDDDARALFSSRDPHLKELSSRIDPGIRMKELGGLYISFDGSKSKPVSSSLQKLKEKKIQDEVMKKSVIGPDFEKKDSVPPYSESKQALKLKHRSEREKTTGDGWFNMKAPEMTQELKGDLQVLKMRSSLDPKRFYKKNDRDGFPKYFQVGTVVDTAADFYHSRVPKKERKRTMVEELLADAEFRHDNKKRYQTIMTDKAAQRAGKRNKKKNKFHKK